MGVNNLILDDRSLEDLYKDLEEKLPFYTPEYSFDLDSDDFGVLLTKVFMKMFIGTIHRYNQVPMKHYIEFLNMLNLTTKAPNPSTGPVVFESKQPVFLEKGTQVLVKSDDKKEKTFELLDAIQVIESQIIGMYQIDRNDDLINNLSDSILNDSFDGLKLFDFHAVKNLQEHQFFITSSQLDCINTDTIVELLFTGESIEAETEFISLLERDAIQWHISTVNGWRPIEVDDIEENMLRFQLRDIELEPVEIMSTKSIWLNCHLPNNSDPLTYGIDNIGLRSFTNNWLTAEILFANDLQCVEDAIYPFTEILQPYNSFYIGSREILTKLESEVTLRFDFSFEDRQFYLEPEPTHYKVVMKEVEFKTIEKTDAYIKQIIWEYWNGLRWCHLEIKGSVINPFTEAYSEQFEGAEDTYNYEMSFICPKDLSLYSVNGVETPWIRARLISLTNAQKPFNTYKVPVLTDLRLSYKFEKSKPVDQIVVQENGQYSLMEKGVKLFQPIDDVDRALYICLNKQPLYGPINVLLDVSHTSDRELSWCYSSENNKGFEWKPLSVIDGTDDLSKIGLVTFYGEGDFTKHGLFGQQGYWLRIKVEDDLDESILLKGIYMNGSWMKQQITIQDEQLINVKDRNNMTFKTKVSPIVNQEVWVNEYNSLSQIDRTAMLALDEFEIKESDNQYWVKWLQVRDFSISELDDRHYRMDANQGLIIFSDGTAAKKPSMKNIKDIKINYTVGGGEEGNFGALSQIKLLETQSQITSIYNPLPCVNGSVAESTEDVVDRGANIFFHRNRAISELDMEQMVSEYTTNIIKSKCFSQVDRDLLSNYGHVLLVVVLKECKSMTFSFELLKRDLLEYMKSISASTFSKGLELSIVQAQPIIIELHLDIYIDEGENVYVLEMLIREKISRFLDIQTGGYYGFGWAIGQMPHTEMVSSVIEEVDKVIAIKNLLIDAYKEMPYGRLSINIENELEPYSIIKEGNHDIKLSYLK